jgi:hypothetical protein
MTIDWNMGFIILGDADSAENERCYWQMSAWVS